MEQDQLLSGDWLEDVFDLEDEIAREKLLVCAEARARSVGCLSQLKRILAAYRREWNQLQKENAKIAANQHRKINLKTNDYGKPLSTIENFLNVLRGDSHFETLRFNLLAYCPETLVDGKAVRWTDTDDAATREYIEREYHFHSKDKCDDALRILFREREYNPAIDLINSIQWDGVPRIKTFLIKWTKCEDTPYTQEVSRLIFAGGIHRLFHPGCKFDDVPVLIGTKQGEGKSTLVRWLAMRDEYFTEVNEIEGQKGMEAIEGAWICELGELLALTKAREVEAVKSFLTRQVDHYRRPYDRRTDGYKRRCIFIGTTNKEQFLTDQTGNRRFYPVRVNQSGYELFDHKEEIQEDIRQCWAEAKILFDKGALVPCADRSILQEIQAIQSSAVEDDYRVGLIESYLEDKRETCVLDLWRNALENHVSKPTKKESNEIGLIMQNMSGWEKYPKAKKMKEFGAQKVWIRNEIHLKYEILP